MALDCKFHANEGRLREEIAHRMRTIKETNVDRCITDLVSDGSPQSWISRGGTLEISITRPMRQISGPLILVKRFTLLECHRRYYLSARPPVGGVSVQT